MPFNINKELNFRGPYSKVVMSSS